MTAPERPTDDILPAVAPTFSRISQREPWSTPTLRVLAASDTQSGPDPDPNEGTLFYGPTS